MIWSGDNMPEFIMGYPKRTGNTEQDLNELYSFVCEMSDRLRYSFEQINKAAASNIEAASEGTE